MDDEEEVTTEILCRCYFPHAAVLKEFFNFASARNCSKITFAEDEIYAGNSDSYIASKKRIRVNTDIKSENGVVTHYRYINYRGSEIGYQWDESVDIKDRNITVSVESTGIDRYIKRCTQKVSASLTLGRYIQEGMEDAYFLTFGDGTKNEGGGTAYVSLCEPENSPFEDDEDEREIRFIDIPVHEMQSLLKMFKKNDLITITALSASDGLTDQSDNGIRFRIDGTMKSFGYDEASKELDTFFLPNEALLHLLRSNITKLSVLHVVWKKNTFMKLWMYCSSLGGVCYYLFPSVPREKSLKE